MTLPDSLERLAALFRKFPGVGEKSARRMVFFLLREQPSFAEDLSRGILKLHEALHACSACGNVTESDPCGICRDPLRDERVMCVVENAEDLLSIEQSGAFAGRYFVLGGRISPMDGEDIAPEVFSRLVERIASSKVEEVLIATNPRVEGDLTAFAVVDTLRHLPLRVTRLACGLPLGGSIGFADRMTLSAAVEARAEIRVARSGEGG